MNRASFGSWGAGLDRLRFAAALAAVGLTGEQTGSRALDAIDDAWRTEIMRWRLPHPGKLEHDPDVLADVWLANNQEWRQRREFVTRDPLAPADELPRLAVELPLEDDPTWLVAQLGLRAIGPLSVHIVDQPQAGRVGWSWPLEVGLLDDPQSRALTALFNDPARFWLGRFVKPRVVSQGVSCDLLLLNQPLRSAAGSLLASAGRASCMLLLRPATGSWTVTGPLLRALQSHLGAAGVGIAPVPPDRLGNWLGAFLAALAHDRPLDVALQLAAAATGSGQPLLIADEALLAESRLTRVAEHLTARAEPGHPMRSAGRTSAPAFDSELHGASELLDLEHELRSVPDAPDVPRHIQARVRGPDRTPWTGALQPGGEHVIGIRVGVADAAWTSAEGPSFPSPEGAQRYRLTVVVDAPEALEEPAVEEIVLPARGSSTECEVVVRPSTHAPRLWARIIVLYRNRVLQTATLDVPVGASATTALRLSAEPEATVRHRLDDLDARRPFDAALLANHDESGTPGLTAVAGDRARVLVPTEFQRAVDLLHDILEDAVLEPDAYDGLDDPSSVELMITLANHGYLLHSTFMVSDGAQAVVDAERLQLVALRTGADFPLEFVYERIAPDPDAHLCPRAKACLEHGQCAADCAPPDDPSVLCPLAFWGLTKSIERVPYRGQIGNHDLEVRTEPSRTDSHLGRPEAALFATSQVVAEEDVKNLRKALQSATRDGASQASSWREWRDFVAAGHPPVLVVLPHTLMHSQLQLAAMEIGGDELAGSNIRADAVCPSREHRPVVVLLGCNTGQGEVPIHDFPGLFRSQGASVVLGTVTKVLGRHAAPVAGRLVAELAVRADAGEAYITEIVRDMRRSLLADGWPLGMTLVAYGDGDWRVGVE